MPTIVDVHELCKGIAKTVDRMDRQGTRICIQNTERIEANRQRIATIVKVMVASAGGGGVTTLMIKLLSQ